MLLYVDDIIIAAKNENDINEITKKLMEKFKMKDKGKVKNFLGLEIDYDEHKHIMTISQKKYIDKLLKRFGFDQCYKSDIPMETKLELSRQEEEINDEKPIRELIGCLMYLMLGTRPDISFAVNFFSRYQDKPTNEVWNHLTKVLRYLQGTREYVITYNKGGGVQGLEAYVDSDWGQNIENRRSVTGYLITWNGNLLNWSTRKQACVALSSAEAELISFCSCVCEGLWFQRLLKDLEINCQKMEVFEDN